MRSMFGWSYPPGAADDPYAPYNQDDKQCPKCNSIDVHTNRGTTGDGLEYSVYVCEDCDWQSDPE